MTTAVPMAASPSVTSLTSDDIDPHLLGESEPMKSQQKSPTTTQPVAQQADVGSNLVRSDSKRISMRRNTVPLVRQDALRNSAATTAATAAGNSSSRTSRRGGHRQVCCYCLRPYDDRRNPKGACLEAPDRMKLCIEWLTCLNLAEGVSYHCCADSEGDYIKPCQLLARSGRAGRGREGSEDSDDDLDDRRHGRNRVVDTNAAEDVDDLDEANREEDDEDATRSTLLERLKAWSCVCLLAVFVPCLCCYPACSLAHRACQRLHLAGGRHVALRTADPADQLGGIKKDPTRNTIAGIAVSAVNDSNASVA